MRVKFKLDNTISSIKYGEIIDMLDDNMAFGLCWSAIIDYFYPDFEYRPLKFHKNLFNTFLAIFFHVL